MSNDSSLDFATRYLRDASTRLPREDGLIAVDRLPNFMFELDEDGPSVFAWLDELSRLDLNMDE